MNDKLTYNYSEGQHLLSETFTIKRSDMIRKMATQFAVFPLCVLLVLVIAAVIASFFDIRWLIVSLMIVFIITPMIMAWLYFFYGMRKECFVNVLPHKVGISPEGITVIVEIKEENYGECSEEDIVKKETFYFFPKHTLRPFSIGMKSISVPVASKNKVSGFLILPESSFGGIEGLNKAARLISDIISSCSTKTLPYETFKKS